MSQRSGQGRQHGDRAALEAPRRTDARQLPHEQPEIEPRDVHQTEPHNPNAHKIVRQQIFQSADHAQRSGASPNSNF